MRTPPAITIISLLLIGASSAMTSTFVDTAGNHRYSDAANWHPVGIPPSYATVVIPANQSVVTSKNTSSVNVLYLKLDGQLTTNAAVKVAGGLHTKEGSLMSVDSESAVVDASTANVDGSFHLHSGVIKGTWTFHNSSKVGFGLTPSRTGRQGDSAPTMRFAPSTTLALHGTAVIGPYGSVWDWPEGFTFNVGSTATILVHPPGTNLTLNSSMGSVYHPYASAGTFNAYGQSFVMSGEGSASSSIRRAFLTILGNMTFNAGSMNLTETTMVADEGAIVNIDVVCAPTKLRYWLNGIKTDCPNACCLSIGTAREPFTLEAW